MTDMHQEITSRSFQNAYATGGDSWTEEVAMRELAKALCVHLQRGSRVLDVGAGRGADTLVLLESGMIVDAIDPVRTPEWTELENTWQASLTFKETTFDEVYSPHYDAILDNGCMHHQPPEAEQAYLTNVVSNLTPGGVYACSVFHALPRRGSETLTAQDGRLSRTFAVDDIVSMLGRYDLEPVEVRVVQRSRPEWKYINLITRLGQR